MKSSVTPDAVTRRNVRGKADEAAAKAGCRFDLERAKHAVDWITQTCRLYEGDHAGELMDLRDWQLEQTRRLFGWVSWSEDLGRWVRRFRKCSGWVPKKNKKSPTIAAWGLYLLVADGEMGQKVYSVAKDGGQAMISHTHAIEMVKRSPELAELCEVCKGTGQITYLPTSSTYKVVAGDNPLSQEGLNGSLMVDETHVVDRQLMRILRGAGISRSEPLHIEVSTAGNNLEGYGRERWEYGMQVERGEREDQQLLFFSYHAPQDLADAELDKDPVKYGKLANPAWGHTIRKEEFLSDYKTARSSLSDLITFKMYRLNIWAASASPWIRAGDWAACAREYGEADLLGLECGAGLDLSKTQDMSSLVLAFPGDEPETYRLLPFFWLPEETAERLNHLVPFLAWARAGLLELTPGAVIDYGFVRSRFRDLARKFRIKKLAYDKTYAEETTQALSDGVMGPGGVVIEEGTGVERLEFRQTVTTFAEPTADFERAVLAGRMLHNNHAILTWQAGHVQVKTDSNMNKRPVKPKPHDVKKIDGIVAAIMAAAVAKVSSSSGSVYDSRTLEVI